MAGTKVIAVGLLALTSLALSGAWPGALAGEPSAPRTSAVDVHRIAVLLRVLKDEPEAAKQLPPACALEGPALDARLRAVAALLDEKRKEVQSDFRTGKLTAPRIRACGVRCDCGLYDGLADARGRALGAAERRAIDHATGEASAMTPAQARACALKSGVLCKGKLWSYLAKEAGE